MIRLGLSMGDPAGIGPEIAIKAVAFRELPSDTSVAIIGDISVLRHAARVVGFTGTVHKIDHPGQAEPGGVYVIDKGVVSPGAYQTGTVNAVCGRASYLYVLEAIRLAKSHEIDAIVTNPINKEALHVAGIDYPGHTEILAHETGTSDFSMMFLLEEVAVVHVTTHCSLRKALDLITAARVIRHIRLLHTTLVGLGVDRPRIAIGGLNPHAGESGLFGEEEQKEIVPAIELGKSEGLNVSGPYPPDTVFMRAFRGEFDGIVSMLHDHGFVALKSKNFNEGVNITIGLPIIRTSVGHGTAFDMAGTGKASERSLVSAITAACRLVSHATPRG